MRAALISSRRRARVRLRWRKGKPYLGGCGEKEKRWGVVLLGLLIRREGGHRWVSEGRERKKGGIVCAAHGILHKERKENPGGKRQASATNVAVMRRGKGEEGKWRYPS